MIGQDIHFSQYDMSPLNLNPALTGEFDGDYRFIGNHRKQWSSVTIPFTTFSFGADANKLPFGPDNIAAGIQINQDRAGDSQFNTFMVNLSGAYKMTLGTDSIQSLSFGLRTGITNRNLNYDPLQFGVQYNGFSYDGSLGNQEAFTTASRTYLDVHLGASYSYYIDKRKNITAGLALFNITRPKQSFYSDDDIRLDARTVFHAAAEWKVSDKIDVMPSMLFMHQGTYNVFNIGGAAKYVLVDFMGTYRTVWAGLYYRNKDATYLSAGMDYDNWQFGLSYDINVSTLVPASNLRGGFEISAIYIIKSDIPKRVLHRICPDYI